MKMVELKTLKLKENDIIKVIKCKLEDDNTIKTIILKLPDDNYFIIEENGFWGYISKKEKEFFNLEF